MKKTVEEKALALKGINDLSLRGEIVVFGSTRMANFPFYELINKCRLENAVYNRSIEGLTIEEASNLLEDLVLPIKPNKVFLALGEEDYALKDASSQYAALVKKLRRALPHATLYLVCLSDQDPLAEKFNENLSSLCDGKNIFRIKFPQTKDVPALTYKAQFKILSRYFRDKPIDLVDVFSMDSL